MPCRPSSARPSVRSRPPAGRRPVGRAARPLPGAAPASAVAGERRPARRCPAARPRHAPRSDRGHPQAAGLAAGLRDRCREQLLRRPSPVSAGQLADALLPVLGTPLGPIADSLALRDIAAVNRLTELDFELPLAGGDRPGAGDAGGELAPPTASTLSA